MSVNTISVRKWFIYIYFLLVLYKGAFYFRSKLISSHKVEKDNERSSKGRVFISDSGIWLATAWLNQFYEMVFLYQIMANSILPIHLYPLEIQEMLQMIRTLYTTIVDVFLSLYSLTFKTKKIYY